MKIEFTKEDLAAMFTAMRLTGVKRFVIDYNGSGDDGQVNGVSALDATGQAFEDVDKLPIPVRYTRFGHRWSGPDEHTVPKVISTETKPLGDVLVQLCYDSLDAQDIDWVNNNGGVGELVIDVDHEDPEGGDNIPLIILEHQYRVESYEDDYRPLFSMVELGTEA